MSNQPLPWANEKIRKPSPTSYPYIAISVWLLAVSVVMFPVFLLYLLYVHEGRSSKDAALYFALSLGIISACIFLVYKLIRLPTLMAQFDSAFCRLSLWVKKNCEDPGLPTGTNLLHIIPYSVTGGIIFAYGLSFYEKNKDAMGIGIAILGIFPFMTGWAASEFNRFHHRIQNLLNQIMETSIGVNKLHALAFSIQDWLRTQNNTVLLIGWMVFFPCLLLLIPPLLTSVGILALGVGILIVPAWVWRISENLNEITESIKDIAEEATLDPEDLETQPKRKGFTNTLWFLFLILSACCMPPLILIGLIILLSKAIESFNTMLTELGFLITLLEEKSKKQIDDKSEDLIIILEE